MFKRLLICTDLTDGLQRLVHFIPSLAVNGIQQVTFLHAIPFPQRQTIPQIDESEAQAARDRLSIPPEAAGAVQVNVEVQGGKPIDCILNAAKVHQPDLLILGTSSQGALSDRFFGSTVSELSKRAIAPLLIVRPQLLSTYTIEELDLRCRHLFRYLLIPFDGSKASDYTIEQVKELAQNQPSGSLQQCLLYWVIGEGKYTELLESGSSQATRKKLELVQTELQAVGLQVSSEISQGEPVPQTLNAAIEEDISAIVCSSGSFGTLMEWSVPSFASEILKRSWHPVLYFPPKRG
ncbi:MAG: universal stress protein [Drouetiella hepatica Uher 2000/2452]|jgi:nucleotide-binding universal stress UspA family protein|uniref:Universal stress protein n=1 Tax=Drouetiella hepatica Uher 2000/2452 TaxID=904376 RepID=A0A951UM60_9CYAN|nr:universal stress protein [Drouetiella hepatica Uher 2000/2452]